MLCSGPLLGLSPSHFVLAWRILGILVKVISSSICPCISRIKEWIVWGQRCLFVCVWPCAYREEKAKNLIVGRNIEQDSLNLPLVIVYPPPIKNDPSLHAHKKKEWQSILTRLYSNWPRDPKWVVICCHSLFVGISDVVWWGWVTNPSYDGQCTLIAILPNTFFFTIIKINHHGHHTWSYLLTSSHIL